MPDKASVERKNLSDHIVKVMVDWFNKNYEDPVHSMPWDDGDYVWLVEQRDAEEELTEMFHDLVHESLIEAAVKEVESDCSQWVKISDLDDMDKESKSSVEDYRRSVDDLGHER